MKKTILETIVGSTLHGTSVDDGLEDLDLMAVCVEGRSDFIGFGPRDTWVSRTKPDGVRSEAGDVDRAEYGLRKFLGLALKCNPTVLLPLFAPENMVRLNTPEGQALRELAPSIVSKKAYAPFRGYMQQQKERLVGTRGQKNCTRPELVEKYGFDTKYAGHIIRLGLQGKELLETGRLELPMVPVYRKVVVDIRTGGYTFEQVLDLYAAVEADLDEAHRKSSLPDSPHYGKVEDWMIDTYVNTWSNQL